MTQLLTGISCCAAVAVIGLGAYSLGSAHTAHASRPLPTVENSKAVIPHDGEARLALAIARLEQRVAMIELRQGAAHEPKAPTAEAVPSEHDAPPDPETSLDVAHQKESEVVAAIDRTLKTETRDRSWAPTAEEQLHGAVKSAVEEGAQFSIKTLRCLTSLCELVLSAGTPDQLRNSVLQVGHRISGMSSYRVGPPEAAADGTSTVTYQLFRQGYPSPGE